MSDLGHAAYRLAMLALQSDRYARDVEYRDAVDDVLGHPRVRLIWHVTGAVERGEAEAVEGSHDCSKAVKEALEREFSV